MSQQSRILAGVFCSGMAAAEYIELDADLVTPLPDHGRGDPV